MKKRFLALTFPYPFTHSYEDGGSFDEGKLCER